MSNTTDDLQMEEAERRIRRAVNAARGKGGDDQVLIMLKDGNGDKASEFGKFKDIIFVAIVLGMGGVTWGQSINNAKLETTVAALQKAVDDLTQEVKALQQRIKP